MMNSTDVTVNFTEEIEQSSQLNDDNGNQQKEMKLYQQTMKYKKTIKSQGTWKIFHCRSCRYRSNRQYNVLRHERRIHTRKIKRICCGKQFSTKGEWYFHCEKFHSNSRPNSIISKEKYKLVGRPKKMLMAKNSKINFGLRRSARIQETFDKQRSLISKEFDTKTIDEIEDLPLIYFIENRELLKTFIEKSNETHKNYQLPMTSHKNEVTGSSNFKSSEYSSVTSSETDNSVSNQVIRNKETVSIQMQTIKLTNSTRDISNTENNFTTSQTKCNFKLSTSYESKTSTRIKTSKNLPLKKRILQELGRNKINTDKENIKPSHTKLIVTRTEQSITWNEITQNQRDFLSSIDFECFKLF